MENRPINSSLPTDPISKVGSKPVEGTRSKQRSEASAEAPAFQVLLERLQQRADELKQSSETVDDARNLAGAVDRARASLEDALSLGDRLLEAYLQAVRQSDSNTPSEGSKT